MENDQPNIIGARPDSAGPSPYLNQQGGSFNTPGPKPETTFVAPKQKSKIGLIITLCVLGALIIGGAIAGLGYLIWRNSDQVVLLDAISNTLDIRAVSAKVDLDLEYKADADSTIKSLKITSNHQNSLIPSSADSTLTITFADDNATTIELGISAIVLEDGVLYFKISGIAEAITKAVANETDEFNSEEDFTEILGSIETLVVGIDDAWIRVSLKEIAESDLLSGYIGMFIDSEEYACDIAAIKNLNSDASRQDLIKLYQKHPFFEVVKKNDTKTGNYQEYEITGVRPELINFLNLVQEKPLFEEFKNCNEDIERRNFSDEDITGNLAFGIFNSDGAVTSNLTFGINPASRELGLISLDSDSDEMKLNLKLEILDRLESVDLSAPADSKPITEILEPFFDGIAEYYLMATSYESYNHEGTYLDL